MDFTPDPADEAIIEIATKALAAVSSSVALAAVSRSVALAGSGSGSPEQLHAELVRSGLLGIAVPARLGGDGLGVGPVMTLLTEVGRHAAPVPLLATLALGALPVVRWGTPAQQDALLADLDAVPLVLTAGLREPGDPLPADPATRATPCGPAGHAVTGVKVGVAQADRARRILVPVSLPAGGTAVALIAPDAPGVSLTATPASSGPGEFTVRLDGVVADGLLGDRTDGRPVADLYRLALAGAVHVGAGALAGALALTTGYIGTREQFGRAIATFQAAAQQIADVSVAARTLRLAALSAAWRLATDRPADDDLAVAAYWLATQAPPALRTCHHLHGGVGLDVTYPLHRYSALVKDLVRLVGGAQACLDRLGGRDVRRPD
jgi:alkylation response protein AidB-like acyl-CoA dehydrogenase